MSAVMDVTFTCADCGKTHRDRRTGRGLCRACYSRHRHRGTLADYPRRNWPAGELLDEWVRLRDDGHTVEQAAKRLGVTYGALKRALERAVARGDQRGRTRAFGRTA